eukprot:gene34602-40583_t
MKAYESSSNNTDVNAVQLATCITSFPTSVKNAAWHLAQFHQWMDKVLKKAAKLREALDASQKAEAAARSEVAALESRLAEQATPHDERVVEESASEAVASEVAALKSQLLETEAAMSAKASEVSALQDELSAAREEVSK